MTLLAQVNLPFKFWWEAVHTAVYHINRLPTPILKLLSPYEKLFKHKLYYSFLKCFSCLCYPFLRDFNRHKFDFHTSKCIFIDYSSSHKGYKCLTNSGQVHILKHVVFNESVFPYPNIFASSSSENVAKSETSVSNFSKQQVYHFSTLPLFNSSFEDTYSVSVPSDEQTHVLSEHTNNIHQQESSSYSLSEPSTSQVIPQIPKSTQTQPEPQTNNHQQTEHNPNKF